VRSCEALAAQAQKGSREAFDLLVARLHEPLYNFLFLWTGRAADAEELTQDAFLRAWQKIGRYDARWRFSTWLYTLAKRLAVSRARASGRRREQQDGGFVGTEQAPLEADPSVAASRSEESANLWSLAARILTENQRTALWLRYAEDRSIEDIARILRRRQVSVRGLLFRAREALAAYLTPASGGRS
jgi:RNA polymerase sigma-70 factor (ECF subfamily)